MAFGDFAVAAAHFTTDILDRDACYYGAAELHRSAVGVVLIRGLDFDDLNVGERWTCADGGKCQGGTCDRPQRVGGEWDGMSLLLFASGKCILMVNPIRYSFTLEKLDWRVSCPGRSVCCIVLMISACANLAQGQISTATLEGTVSDPSGGVVAGATVALKNLGTQVSRTVTTGSSGEYTIPNLPVAHYSVSVTAPGFKTYNISDVELQVAQRATVNVSLQVGGVEQEITVGATTPIVETSQSSVGQVVNPSTVEHMPLNGRSFWQLTDLTPGATYTPGGQQTRTGGSSIRSSAVNVTINGTAPNQTGWFLDGAFITEMQTGGTLIQPNVDALQEFKVESSNMSAEYGHTPNVVNVSLKSGTNGFHGTAFEFLRNSAFDAKNFFYVPPAGSKETIEPLRRNQYGFAVGGPIRRDKTFFFADFEKTGLLQGVDFNNAVPSLAERTGNFSQITKKLVNPTGGYKTYPGNIIPVTSFSPQALFFLNYMPTPNTTQGSTSYSALTNNLQQHEMRGDVRIDEQITGSTQLTGRYSINDNQENDPNNYLALGSFPLHSRAQNATVSLTHIFNPKLLNEARVSYYRSYFYFAGSLQGTNFNQLAGVQGFNDTTSVYSFPYITLTNYSNFTGSPSDQRPETEPDSELAVCGQRELHDWPAQH